MIKNKKKILLIFIIIVLIIIIFIKNFTNKKELNQISYNEILIENEISNTKSSIETIKVHITGEVNNPRTC